MDNMTYEQQLMRMIPLLVDSLERGQTVQLRPSRTGRIKMGESFYISVNPKKRLEQIASGETLPVNPQRVVAYDQ